MVPSRWIVILRCEPILHRHNNRFGLVRPQPHRPVRSRDAARHPSAAMEIDEDGKGAHGSRRLVAANRNRSASALALAVNRLGHRCGRSDEHTSELQALMRSTYAVFCLKNNTHAPTA